jgi:hypothetical protein
MRAREVRQQQGLPEDGRSALEPLERLERVLRQVFAPDVPTYDVDSIQAACFDEWCYTEGLGCLMVFTQSVEINARLMLAAAVESEGGGGEGAVAGMRLLGDKWRLKPGGDAQGRRVFFAPGANRAYTVDLDRVQRAFAEDSSWVLKPHPVTSDDDVHAAKMRHGVTRLCDGQSSGMALLRTCSGVGYTTGSEMGLVGMLLGLDAVDFTLWRREHVGRYHPLYFALRRSGLHAAELLDRVTTCPWSGIVPLATPDEEAAERFRAYKARSLQLRDEHAPLVRSALLGGDRK